MGDDFFEGLPFDCRVEFIINDNGRCFFYKILRRNAAEIILQANIILLICKFDCIVNYVLGQFIIEDAEVIEKKVILVEENEEMSKIITVECLILPQLDQVVIAQQICQKVCNIASIVFLYIYFTHFVFYFLKKDSLSLIKDTSISQQDPYTI